MYLKLIILVNFVILNEVCGNFSCDKEALIKTCNLPDETEGKCVNIKQCPQENKYLPTCPYGVCCKPTNTTLDLFEKCGRNHEYNNICVIPILGGENALYSEFPHMAALGYGDKNNIQWKCGGSLINNRFVLTAAHCLNDRITDVKFVRLGNINLKGQYNVQIFEVIRRIPHPEYKPPKVYHDIALLELDREVRFNEDVRPGCLQTEPLLAETLLQAIGWGLTETGQQPSILQKVTLKLFNHDECQLLYRSQPKRKLPRGISEAMQVCASGDDEENPKDTCQGDSGGPLHYLFDNHDDLFAIVGVTSFGKVCGTGAGVYSRVSYYVPWIESVVSKEALCICHLPISKVF